MAEVGIGFKLHGDASEFEKAISRSKESLEGLHKEARGFNATMRFLKEGAVGFGLVEAFGKVIEKAQKLREESEKNGTAIDNSVAAMARYGDAIDNIKETSSAFTVKFFGSLIHGWELVGDFLRGNKFGTLDAVQGTEEESAKAAKVQAANLESAKRVEEIRKKGAFEAESDQEKINSLAKDNFDIVTQISRLAEDDTRRNALREQFEKNIVELKKRGLDVTKKEAEEADKIQAAAMEASEHRKELISKRDAVSEQITQMQGASDEEKADRGRMSLQELANVGAFDTGVSGTARNKGEDARQVMSLEQSANAKRLAGDQGGYSDDMKSALDIRKSLDGVIHKAESDPNAGLGGKLDAANVLLNDINNALQGKFKSQ